MKTVLIIDSDLGFVFWLGHGLDQAGYAAFPAQTAHDAKRLLDAMNVPINLLIINTGLRGAVDFVTALRRLNQDLKVVATTDYEDQPDLVRDADLRCRKPEATDQTTRRELISQIKQLMPPFTPN